MTISTAVAAIAAVLLAVPAAAQWTQQNSGTTEQLTGVSFSDDTTGVVVGSGGIVLTTDNGGTTWTHRHSGTERTLRDICTVHRTLGTAVGDTGTILRTADGGRTWTPQYSGTALPLLGVAFADSARGIAVGGDSFAGRSILLRTTDGGTTWTQPPSPLDGWFHTVLFDIAFADSAHAVAVGRGAQQQGDRAAGIVLRTANGGASWTVDTVDDHSLGFNGIALTGSTAVAVAEFGSIHHSTDGGATWTRRVDNSAFDTLLSAVSFGTAYTGTAVGTTFDSGSWPLPGAHILRTTDGGTTWIRQNPGIEAFLLDVCFTDAWHGTIVGFGGLILRTTNGGGPVPALSWTPDSVNFGGVIVQTPRDSLLSGVLHNTGTADLAVTAFRFDGADAASFSLPSPPALPLVLQPGETASLTVTFTPAHAGPHRARLVPETAAAALPLHLLGCGSTTSRHIDMGSVAVGTSRDTVLAVANSELFTVYAATDALTGPAVPFRISATSPALPTAVPAGDSLFATVRFAPTATGTTTSSLTIVLRAGDGAVYPLHVTLGGEGTTATGVEEQPPSSIGTNPILSIAGTQCTVVLPKPGRAQLGVFDSCGRKVRTWQLSGPRTEIVEWDGTAENGRPCATGLYRFLVITDTGVVPSQPVILLR